MALATDESGFPAEAANGIQNCSHCQHCMMICPAAALSIDGITPEQCSPAGNEPDPQQLLSLIRNRRSFRFYKRENIDKEVIASLLDSIRYSPTGMNRRALHLSVIDDYTVMDSVRDYVNNKILALPKDSAAYSVFEASMSAIREGRDPIFRHAPHLLLVSTREYVGVDPFIALSYFELLAQASGVATVWCGRAHAVFEMVTPELLKNTFYIPEGHVPGYVMLFGTPAISFKRGPVPPVVPIKIAARPN